jgi:hypothetical protein
MNLIKERFLVLQISIAQSEWYAARYVPPQVLNAGDRGDNASNTLAIAPQARSLSRT